MDLYIDIPNSWLLFCFTLAATLITGVIMQRLSADFVTLDGLMRKFSIMELEFPSKPEELVNIIGGIFMLPPDKKEKSLRALKANLWLDFLFMPGIYGSVFLLCMHISSNTVRLGHPLFATLAWLQVVALLCDVFENAYLLRRITPMIKPSGKAGHRVYTGLVITKWLIAMVGGVCSLLVLFYFWLSGRYDPSNLFYLLVILGEIGVCLLLGRLLKKRE